MRTRDADDSRRDVPQGRPRQGRHRQVPRRAARRAEGRLRRHHHQRALHPAPDAAGDPHRVPRVLRPGARFDAGDRRDQGLSRCAAESGRRARDARGPRASRRALRQGGRLRDEGEAARPAEDGAARRHRRRERRRRRARPRPKWCASPTRAAPKASSPCRRTRARNSGSTARAPPRSPGTPTRSRSTRTSSSRSPRLGDYTDGIERINIELSLAQQARARRRARRSSSPSPLFDARCGAPDSDARPAQEVDRREARRGARAGRAACARAGRTCSTALDETFPRAAGPRDRRVVEDASCKAPLERDLRGLRVRAGDRSASTTSTRDVLRSRVFVALHMHAGDGNVHTNIPVNSDDYAMLQEANAAVARIMALARALGGVISGEHGIGITKLEFLTDDELAPFADYKRARRSARAASTAASCCATGALPADLSQRVHAELLADRPREPDPRAERDRRRSPTSIKDCLRCGKCKPPCATHVAAREPALQPAQQDPRDVAADRGVPVRGADAARRQPRALQRVRRRRRPLHGLPQVREPVPGRHRLRRRVDRDAQPPAHARASATSIPARRRRCSS